MGIYTPSGNPQSQSRGVSSSVRAEFQLIAAAFTQLQSTFGYNVGLDIGTANTYQVNLTSNVTQLSQFMEVVLLVANTNTATAPTLTISGVGTAPIIRHDGTPIQPGDIKAGGIYEFYYDGTYFQLQANPLSGTATGQIKFNLGTSVSSASTVSLDTVVGNYAHITGTTTINAITLTAGWFMVVFDGSLTLTNGANLILPGGANIITQPGDCALFLGDAGGVVRCAVYTPINPASAAVVPNGYINGFTLSNSGTTSLAIAAGQAKDSTNTTTIAVNSITKSISAVWASGTGNGGMGTGVVAANNTWYHAFAVIVGGVNDVYFDTSITAANKPASTTAFRYIGSFKTNGSAQITPFTQIGQKFFMNTLVNDVDTTASSGTITLNVPPGISVFPTVSIQTAGSSNATNSFSILNGLNAQVDGTVTGVGTVFSGTGQISTTTNTSGQVTFTSANNGDTRVATIYYINPKVAANN